MRNNGATDDYAKKAREALKRTGFTSVNGKDYITYTAETESAEASLVLSNFKTGGVSYPSFDLAIQAHLDVMYSRPSPLYHCQPPAVTSSSSTLVLPHTDYWWGGGPKR